MTGRDSRSTKWEGSLSVHCVCVSSVGHPGNTHYIFYVHPSQELVSLCVVSPQYTYPRVETRSVYISFMYPGQDTDRLYIVRIHEWRHGPSTYCTCQRVKPWYAYILCVPTTQDMVCLYIVSTNEFRRGPSVYCTYQRVETWSVCILFVSTSRDMVCLYNVRVRPRLKVWCVYTL